MSGKNHFYNTALEQLVQKPYSRVLLKKAIHRIYLSPCYLKDPSKGIWEALYKKCKVYDPQLEGFLLAWKKVSVQKNSNNFLVCGLKAEIQIFVEVEGYIFQPKIGCILEGTVNYIGSNHLVVLVHSYFNAIVLRGDFEEQETWDERTRHISKGDTLLIKITDLDFSGALPDIKADILSFPNKKEFVTEEHVVVGNKSHENNHAIGSDKNLNGEEISDSGYEDQKEKAKMDRFKNVKKKKKKSGLAKLLSSTQLRPCLQDDEIADFDFLSPIPQCVSSSEHEEDCFIPATQETRDKRKSSSNKEKKKIKNLESEELKKVHFAASEQVKEAPKTTSNNNQIKSKIVNKRTDRDKGIVGDLSQHVRDAIEAVVKKRGSDVDEGNEKSFEKEKKRKESLETKSPSKVNDSSHVVIDPIVEKRRNDLSQHLRETIEAVVRKGSSDTDEESERSSKKVEKSVNMINVNLQSQVKIVPESSPDSGKNISSKSDSDNNIDENLTSKLLKRAKEEVYRISNLESDTENMKSPKKNKKINNYTHEANSPVKSNKRTDHIEGQIKATLPQLVKKTMGESNRQEQPSTDNYNDKIDQIRDKINKTSTLQNLSKPKASPKKPLTKPVSNPEVLGHVDEAIEAVVKGGEFYEITDRSSKNLKRKNQDDENVGTQKKRKISISNTQMDILKRLEGQEIVDNFTKNLSEIHQVVNTVQNRELTLNNVKEKKKKKKNPPTAASNRLNKSSTEGQEKSSSNKIILSETESFQHINDVKGNNLSTASVRLNEKCKKETEKGKKSQKRGKKSLDQLEEELKGIHPLLGSAFDLMKDAFQKSLLQEKTKPAQKREKSEDDCLSVSQLLSQAKRNIQFDGDESGVTVKTVKKKKSKNLLV